MYNWASSPPVRQKFLRRPFDEEDPCVATFIQKKGVSGRWGQRATRIVLTSITLFEDDFDLRILTLKNAVDERR
jgi:hypothetical protein